VRWGVHPPYAAVGAWDRAPDEDRPVPSAARTLVPFVAHCLRRNVPFRLEELTGRTALDAAAGPLATASGRFMERALQQRLARFAEHGGALLLLGELPSLDEHLNPCTELADAVARCGADRTGRVRTVPPGERPVGTTVEEWLHDTGDVPARPGAGAWIELRRTTADPAEDFVFLLNRSNAPLTARTECGGRTVTVDLVGGGCAAVQVSHGRLGACYLKGLNEQTGAAVPARVRVGRDLLTADRPCDLSVVRGPGGLAARTAAGQGEADVVLRQLP
jgi:beta-galactosidase